MRIWKKYIALLMAIAAVFTLAACGSKNKEKQTDPQVTEPSVTDQQPTEAETGNDVGVEEKTETADITGAWLAKWDATDFLTSTIKMLVASGAELPDLQVYVILDMEFTQEGEFSLRPSVDQESMDNYLDALDVQTAMMVRMAMDGVVSEIANAASIKGFYEQENQKVWVALEQEKLAETDNYLELTVEDNTMIVTKYSGHLFDTFDQVVNSINAQLPWELERQVSEQTEA